MKNKKIELKYILPPLIYLLFIIFTSIISQKFPFGNDTWYTSDFYHQYQTYIIEFREKFLSFNGLKEFFFSTTTPMGSNYWTEFSYYCSSPLNLIMLIVPSAFLNQSINLLLIFKLLLIPISFNYYINKKYNLTTTSAIILTSSYAFSSFFIYNLWNIIWIECFALFPLIILFLEKGIKENKWTLYTITLFLSIWCNFYISFIICIGITFYFFILIKFEKESIKKFIKFAIYSILAALMNSILLIPLLLELSGELSSGFPSFKIYNNFINILANHLPLGNIELVSSDFSNAKLYIGLLPLIILPLFFTNKNISKKEKILYPSLLLFLIISFNTEPLNYIWHGCHHPQGITNRFSFIYYFIIIDMCGKVLNNKEYITISIKHIILESILLISISLLANVQPMCIEITIFFVIIYFIYILILNLTKNKNPLKLKKISNFLCLILLSELIVCSIIYTLSLKTNTLEEANTNEVKNFITNNINNENDFYRIDINRTMSEKLEFKEALSMNIEKSINIPSVSGFSSLINKNLKNAKQTLGIGSNSITIKNDNINPITGNLFSLKYLINQKNNNLIKINNMFELIKTDENYELYKNKFYMQPIIKINSDVKEKNNKNPFENLNNILKSFSNINKDVFETIDVKYNIKENKNNKKNNDLQVNLRHYEYIIEFEEIESDNLYMMLPQITNSSMQLIYLNDKVIHGEYSHGFLSTLQIGKITKNDKLKIVYFIPDEKEPNLKSFYTNFATFNENIYTEIYTKLSKETLNFNINKNKITFETNSNNENLYYISMAYHKGWKAYINDKETEIVPLIYNSMIGIKVPSGTNTITLEFTPPGFYKGLTISLISLLCFVFITFFKKKNLINT